MNANHIILEALGAAVYDANKRGEISDQDVEHYIGNEPVSHVFVPYGDMDEDDLAAIREASEADLVIKIAYWRGVVDSLAD